MRKKSYIIFAMILAIVAVFHVSPSIATGEDKPFTVWGTYGTEKILQDASIDYSSIKSAAKIDLDVAHGESEYSQIVITTGNKAVNYEVELNDLTLSGDSSVKFSANKVSVYSAMYCLVNNLYNGGVRSFNKGMFPDAMLPYENAVQCGENHIDANCNQSLYFSFNISDDQPNGVYTGNFKVIVDGSTVNVPVSVRVRDIFVRNASSHKIAFLTGWYYYLGEYNSSQRMLDNYVKFLIDNRLCTANLVSDSKYGQEDAEYYAQKIVEFYEYGSDEERFGVGADRFTNYRLWLSYSSRQDYINKFIMYTYEIAKVSCEKGVDFLTRAFVYQIDEPEGNNGLERLKVFNEMFLTARAEAASNIEEKRNELKSVYGVDDAFIDILVASAGGIHNLVTQSYLEKYDGYVETWVPLFDSYDNQRDVQKYKELNPDERWWYGCVIPKAPYPTYEIDDIIISPRLLGWLEAYYGISGRLFWGVDAYTPLKTVPGDSTYRYRYTDDYYTESCMYANIPGDGFLTRPGKKYGVDGPIGTLRTYAIKDGLEEYELLQDIKDVYAEIESRTGISCNVYSTIESMLSSLCNGVSVVGNSESFATARKELLDFYEFTATNVVFTEYSDNGKGKIEYTLFVPEETTLEVENAEQKSVQNCEGGKIYTYAVDMQTSTASSIVFKATKDNEMFTLTRMLPGRVAVYDVDNATAQEFSGDVNGANIVNYAEYGDVLQLPLSEVGANEARRYQKVSYYSQYLKGIDEQVLKLSFNFVFLPTDTTEQLKLKICIKYKNKVALVEEYFGDLTYGNNYVVLSGLYSSISKNGEIERIDFRFGLAEAGEVIAARSDVYFAGAIVQYVS